MAEKINENTPILLEYGKIPDSKFCGQKDRHAEQNLNVFEQDTCLRLSKRLCYILRYGAQKEGLQVDGSGFVDLKALMTLSLFEHYSFDEVLEHIRTSQSHRGTQRFEVWFHNGRTLVRAAYGRQFEKNPYHYGTKVRTLFETCILNIINNLYSYDLQSFPDEYIISTILHKLKREKRLNNRILKVLLVPVLEHLDLEEVNLTMNTLHLIFTQCPHLKSLSLRNCGYIVTDTILSQLSKKLPELEFLNLTGCSHLTDRCIKYLIQNLPNLQCVGLSCNKGITETGVIELLAQAPALKHLDIFALKASPEAIEKIHALRCERAIVVLLQGLAEQDEYGNLCHIQPRYHKGIRKPFTS